MENVLIITFDNFLLWLEQFVSKVIASQDLFCTLVYKTVYLLVVWDSEETRIMKSLWAIRYISTNRLLPHAKNNYPALVFGSVSYSFEKDQDDVIRAPVLETPGPKSKVSSESPLNAFYVLSVDIIKMTPHNWAEPQVAAHQGVLKNYFSLILSATTFY